MRPPRRQAPVQFSGQLRGRLSDLQDERGPGVPPQAGSLPADNTAELSIWRQRLVEELAGREEGMSDGQQLIPAQVPVWRFGSGDEVHLG